MTSSPNDDLPISASVRTSVFPARILNIDANTTAVYTLSLHDALPISGARAHRGGRAFRAARLRVAGHRRDQHDRSEEHTSELQSQFHLVCRLLLEKKKT